MHRTVPLPSRFVPSRFAAGARLFRGDCHPGSLHRRRGQPVRSIRSIRSAFTLIELMIALAIIGLLLVLGLPAIQAAREASRRTQCRNNLRNLTLAVLNAESTFGTLPSNGWGYRWTGDPGRGYGPTQPGGWIFHILPQIDQRSLFEAGQGEPDPVRKAIAFGNRNAHPVAVLRCPSRPGDVLGPARERPSQFNASFVPLVQRTDYAICEGDVVTDTGEGPPTLSLGDDPTYQWSGNAAAATGACYQRSAVRLADLIRGGSNVLLIAEKHVPPEAYQSGREPGHDQTALSGVDWDIARWTAVAPSHDSVIATRRAFGAAHPGSFSGAFCDGSVRNIDYEIDLSLHRQSGRITP